MKKTVKWLFENFGEENETNELVKTAINLGYSAKTCDTLYFNECNLSKYYDTNKVNCVVPHVSLQSANSIIHNAHSWIPGIWSNLDEYDSNKYYPFFADNLLNNKYAILPIGDVKRRINDLYDWLGIDGKIFIKPLSGRKLFAGQIFKKNDFDFYWNAFDKENSKTDLIMASVPKNILAEYRLIVGNKKVITGSQYILNGEKKYKKLPQYIEDYANEILSKVDYNPCPVWVLDVALDSENAPYVLEVGCFNCSYLYACDKEKLIEEVSQIAYNYYKEVC